MAAKQQALADRRDISFSQYTHMNIRCFFSSSLARKFRKVFSMCSVGKIISFFFIFLLLYVLCRSTYDLHLHLAALICECIQHTPRIRMCMGV